MSDRLPSPMDEITELPNLILPYDTGGDDFYDYHHVRWPRRVYETDEIRWLRFKHELDPESLSLEALGMVVARMSMGQMLPRRVHDQVHLRLDGSAPPQGVDEMFMVTVKACSGFVSRWAVDLRRPDNDLLVYMDTSMFERITRRAVLCTERAYDQRDASYRRYIFGNFLMRYAISKDLSHISGPMVREFVGTSDERRKKELGGFILRRALDARLDPIIPVHELLAQQGWIPPAKRDIRSTIKKLIPKESLPALLPELSAKLAAAS